MTFGIYGLRGEVLVHALEEAAIYVSTTSACSSKAGSPAGTLLAMGIKPQLASTAVRLSLSGDNTVEEVKYFLDVFDTIYHQTQKIR